MTDQHNDDLRRAMETSIATFRILAAQRGICWDCVLEGADIAFNEMEPGDGPLPEPTCATESKDH